MKKGGPFWGPPFRRERDWFPEAMSVESLLQGLNEGLNHLGLSAHASAAVRMGSVPVLVGLLVRWRCFPLEAKVSVSTCQHIFHVV